MKKLVLLAMVFVLTFTMCACGGRGNDSTTESTTESTDTPTILPMPSTNATLDPVPDPSASEDTIGTEETGELNDPSSSNEATDNGNLSVG